MDDEERALQQSAKPAPGARIAYANREDMKIPRPQPRQWLNNVKQRLFSSSAASAPGGPSRDPPSPADQAIIRQVRPYTMTNELRIRALLEGVDYVVRAGVEGAFAECGVWLGGSVLAMILRLQQHGVGDRDIFLYDTFEGMTQPGEHDLSDYDEPALDTWKRADSESRRPWDFFFKPELFNLDAVRRTLLASGYPASRIHLVKGPVEQTIPAQAPESLALLRLDTDWYESTRHEMQHLYPRIAGGGVLIVDDYGHWQGCRRAVDEYFGSGQARPVLLNRIDYTARIAVKP
jgi:hypothetical protein